MKVVLLYFSGTGATAKMAQIIGKGIISKGHHVNYVRLTRNIIPSLEHYELVGIGAPAYSFRAPRIVSRLLNRVKWQNKPYFLLLH